MPCSIRLWSARSRRPPALTVKWPAFLSGVTMRFCNKPCVAMLAARASIQASRLDLRTLSFDSERFLTFTDWIIFRLHLALARRLDGHARLLIRPTKPQAPPQLLRRARRGDLARQGASA